MKKHLGLSLALSGASILLFSNVVLASTTGIVVPTSDGNYLQWTPSTGTTHYTLVNESACNGTTNYVNTNTTGNRDSYGVNISSIGNGSTISQIAIVPCASRDSSSGGGSSTLNVFYRYNGVNSSDTGSYALSGTTPTQLATSTYSSLNLFKTSTSTLEIGAVYSAGTRGARLSRIATVVTYSLTSPGAPTSLSATNYSSTQNNLSWTDNATNELGYKIYHSMDNGSYSLAGTITWNRTSYSDTSLTADHTYSYKVVAYNDAGTATSNIATAITYNTAPPDPSSLTATSSGSNVVLGWTDNSTNEDLFSVERKTEGGSFSQIATTTLNLTGTAIYTDVGAASGSYYYRVRAYNIKGYSGYSNTASYNIPTGPDTVYVSGTISSATTWSPVHIYVVNGSVTVNSGVTLTINAGTIVKFSSGTALTVNGTLNAQNVSTSTIYFTSIKDDTVGGDTNGDTTSTSPAAGDWDTIQINAGGTANIDYAVIRYAGSNSFTHYAGLYVSGGILNLSHSESTANALDGVFVSSGTSTITSCNLHNQSDGVHLYSSGSATLVSNTIHDNSDYGVYVNGGTSLTLTNNTFTNNATAPVYFDVGSAAAFTHSGNTASGGGISGYHMLGTFGQDETWSASDLPYIIYGMVIPTGKTLTLGQGVVLKMVSQIAIDGSLVANGTSGSKVYFTSIKDDSADGKDTNNDGASSGAAGDWDTIQINSGGTANLEYTVMRYAGFNSYTHYTGIYVNGGTLNFTNSEAATNYLYGIYENTGTANVTSSVLHDLPYAFRLTGSGSAALASNSIHDNSVYGVDATAGSLNLTDNTFYGNAADIYVDPAVTYTHYSNQFNSGGSSNDGIGAGGTISSDTTWNAASTTPYVVTSTLTIAEGATLTINPGVVVKFSATTSKIVVEGALNAAGSATGTIYFTSYKDDAVGGDTNGDCSIYAPAAGDWDSITILSGASSTLANTVIRYDGLVWNNGGLLNVSHSEVTTSTLYGIYTDSGTSTITYSDIHNVDNNYYGVKVDGGTVSVSRSKIHDNFYGLYITAGTLSATASDVFANHYGFYDAGGNPTINESAIHDNSSYGAFNSTQNDLDATNNYWGCYAGANSVSPPCHEGASGDATSAHVNTDSPSWHHTNGYWQVRNFALKWYSTSQYSNELDAATFNWNSTTSGMGIIPVSSTSSSLNANTLISDYTDSSDSTTSGKSVCGITGTPTSSPGTIQFNTYCMDIYMPGIVGLGAAPAVRNAVVVHELGHALGLGHSDPVTDDVMYSTWDSFKTDGFGADDRRDYTFLWDTIRWATSSWWPK